MKRLLGIDFGTRRIGIAVSDPLRVIARGLTVVRNSPRAVMEIARLTEEYDVEKIVVGLPLTLKGEKGQKAKEVEAFAEELRKVLRVDVVFWDERFSSHAAHETLRTMGVRKKARRSKERIDEMASAIILQGYLDSTKS